jgi:GxxExxY protein
MHITKLVYKDECYALQGCIFEVNRKLGSGFLEAVYQEALEIEFRKAQIPFESQKPLVILYEGKPLHQQYVADFVCFGNIIVEIKAVSKLTDTHKAQVINYLAATGFRLGLLVNFGTFPKATIVRVVRG